VGGTPYKGLLYRGRLCPKGVIVFQASGISRGREFTN